jgi:hypothetical protein
MRFNTPQAGNGGMNWNFPSWAFLATGGDRGQGWPVVDGVAFKATAILDLADHIVSDLNRSKRHARLIPSVHNIVEPMKEPINWPVHTIANLNATRRKLQEQAGNFNDENTRAAATIALRRIDAKVL